MSRLLVWYGELGTAGSILRRGLALLLPALLWLMAFLILPSLALVAVAFAERGNFGEIIWNFSLENLSRLLGYGIFGWSPDNLIILARTVWVAFITTLISGLLAYPLAFFIASRKPQQRYLWLALVIIPFWTNLVIRTYAWQLLFAPQMPFARIAAALHLIEPGTALNPSSFAVYVGMVSAFLPFLVLPLYSSVERLDWSLVEAAQDLYGGRSRVFFQAILPQTLPGLTVGVILTFIPAMGMFVVPDLLGGAKYLLVGNLIQQQFFSSRDWPFGAALSLGLVLLTLIALRIYRRSGKDVDLV
ncbi:MAG: ABC transporter permease [Deinococcota bacterium]